MSARTTNDKRRFLAQKQAQPLDIKIKMSQARIREWYIAYRGSVFVSFSGGMDSTVLLHLVRSMYPDVPAVCINAQLYPEIYRHVKRTPNVEIIKPRHTFRHVVERWGYPVISKRQAQYIGDAQRGKRTNSATYQLRTTGIRRSDGGYSPMGMISKKWQYLIDAPFCISDKCCKYLKEQPLNDVQKRLGNPLIGIRVTESRKRTESYLEYGCNAFDLKRPRSWPLAFWTDGDIWEYVRRFNVSYSSLYDMGYRRSGCMFCMFGVHLEKEPNRFQRMKITHPKAYDVAINKLGLGEIMDFLGVNYEPPAHNYLSGFAPCKSDRE